MQGILPCFVVSACRLLTSIKVEKEIETERWEHGSIALSAQTQASEGDSAMSASLEQPHW